MGRTRRTTARDLTAIPSQLMTVLRLIASQFTALVFGRSTRARSPSFFRAVPLFSWFGGPGVSLQLFGVTRVLSYLENPKGRSVVIYEQVFSELMTPESLLLVPFESNVSLRRSGRNTVVSDAEKALNVLLLLRPPSYPKDSPAAKKCCPPRSPLFVSWPSAWVVR